MTSTPFSPVSQNYAQSLLELAGDQAESIGQELAGIREITEQTPAFRVYLADPAIGQTSRGEMLARLFEGKASQLVFNFLRVLNSHNRLALLVEITGAYDELLDEKLGKVEVDLTVARPLNESQLAAAQQKISHSLGKDAVVHTYVDESIIGGMIIRVGDELIDASVRSQLQAMKRQMLEKMPK